MRKNYKSDFDFILRLYSCLVDSEGNVDEASKVELGWPGYDWEAKIYTSVRPNAYVASCIGGVCTNCYNDNGQIHIVVNNHNMGAGRVKVEFRAELPREIYPDGYQRNVVPQPIDIELVVGKGDLPSEMEADMLLPYIKGEPFTYEDFTPAQIADLKRPAVEAATKLDAFVKTASEAETVREANERARVKAESTRESKETARQSAETTRQGNETKRVEAEALRERAENEREAAEKTRATEFESWESEIDGKADRSELSNIVGEPTGNVIEEIEPTLVADALRKTAQTLTPEEQAQVKQNIGIEERRVFDDLVRKLGVTINADGTYGLNGLTLTYEEMLAVYNAGRLGNNDTEEFYANTQMRTHLPGNIHGGVIFANGAFRGNTVEVVNLWMMAPRENCFNGCTHLHTATVYSPNYNTSRSTPDNNWQGCSALVNLTVTRTYNVSFSLEWSPLISLASMQMIVSKTAAGGAAFTITVHPDVYAKLTDESNAEWYAVLTAAASKNITFATI